MACVRMIHPPNRRVLSRHASRAFIPAAEPRSPPRRMPSRRASPDPHPRPPCRPAARPRLPTMPSADCCGTVRGDSSALSPSPGHPAALPWSAVIPSVQRRRSSNAPPHGGGTAVLLRARSPRRYHPSSPVRVPRPARSFHPAFRPPRAVTPGRVPCPSAPRTPGQETFPPSHDRMPGTHAKHAPRAPARRLQALVRLWLRKSWCVCQIWHMLRS
jgi:hypothetical protein